MIKKLIVIFLFIMLPKIIFGQQFYRIKAEFSIKVKLSDENSQLTMGTIYYDKNSKKLIYKIKFPEPEIWVSQDTVLYKIVNNKIIERESILEMTEFSIFHLSLNGRLPDYGLRNTIYSVTNVAKEGDMVITSWEPQKGLNKNLGKILISNIKKQLFGIIFYGPDEEIKSKQFFEEYKNYMGLDFPGKIVQISYVDNREVYQVTTFKNVIINDIKENDIYNFTIPDL